MNFEKQPPKEIVDIFKHHKVQYFSDDFSYYAWPQVFGSTAGPTNGMGGADMCAFTVECWVADGSGPYVCLCAGMYSFQDKRFTPFININDWKPLKKGT